MDGRACESTKPHSMTQPDRFPAVLAFIESGAVHSVRLARQPCPWLESIVLRQAAS